MTSKRSTKALLKKARPRTEKFEVALDLGDGLYDDLEAAEAEYDAGAKPGPEKEALEQRISGLVDRIAEETVLHGRMQMQSFGAWEALKGAHPARTTTVATSDGEETTTIDPADEAFGVNTATFFPVALRQCIVEPEMDDEDWENFRVAIAPGDWVRLSMELWLLNGRPVNVPKVPRDWRRTVPPGDDSKSAAAGA